MYDGKTQLLVRNPIGRYLINSTMLPSMKKSPDGSLTIYIQKDVARESHGLELAPRARWAHLPRDAALLAEGRVAVDPAAG